MVHHNRLLEFSLSNFCDSSAIFFAMVVIRRSAVVRLYPDPVDQASWDRDISKKSVAQIDIFLDQFYLNCFTVSCLPLKTSL
jgi:hypothetical protein